MSQVHYYTAPAVGQKDIIQPPAVRKVNAHVAHRGLYEPQGIVNKVKAPEGKLNRGYKGPACKNNATPTGGAVRDCSHVQ